MLKQINQLFTKKKGKLPLSLLAAYGVGGIIPIALFNIAGQLMGLIGNISLGLSAFWLGVILIIPRLWDAISDPIIGHFSDNYSSRWGRRRPFILIGGIAVAISFVLMWWIPDSPSVQSWFPTETAYEWFNLGYILLWLLIFFTACTVFEIPHGALGMEMSKDPHERTRLFSSKSFFGNLFAMSTPWLFALANMEYFKGPGGNEADGMKYVSILIAVVLIPLSFWWFFGLKEPNFKVAVAQKKTAFWKDIKHTFKNKTFISLVIIVFTLAIGFNFVNLLGYYIPIFYIFEGDKAMASTLLGINGTVWAVTGLLAVFPLNWISPKFGKRKTLLFAIGLMSLAQASKIVCYNQEYPYLVIIPTILLSAGMLFFFTLGSSMVGDICDEDALKTGRRAEGSYYSIFWWFIKMGTALASFVAGALIVFTQFDESQVTKVDDLKGAVNELQVKIEDWNTAENTAAYDFELQKDKLQSYNKQAVEETQDFIKFLENKIERNKKSDKKNAEVLAENKIFFNAKQRADQILRTLLKKQQTRVESSNLEVLENQFLETLKINLLKAKVYTHIVDLHFKHKSVTNTKSKKHNEYLKEQLKSLNEELLSLPMEDSLVPLDNSISGLENNIAKLTKQSPYSLLLMRVIEIGLPLLLCMVSFFFTYRYRLTEERTQEIKKALEKRNLKNSETNPY